MKLGRPSYPSAQGAKKRCNRRSNAKWSECPNLETPDRTSRWCEPTRAGVSIDRLVEDAEALGANAVIGMRFQTSMIQTGAAEMLCYGTGVIVEADG